MNIEVRNWEGAYWFWHTFIVQYTGHFVDIACWEAANGDLLTKPICSDTNAEVLQTFCHILAYDDFGLIVFLCLPVYVRCQFVKAAVLKCYRLWLKICMRWECGNGLKWWRPRRVVCQVMTEKSVLVHLCTCIVFIRQRLNKHVSVTSMDGDKMPETCHDSLYLPFIQYISLREIGEYF